MPELLDLIYRIFVLELFLETLCKALNGGRLKDDPIRETARLTSDIDEAPEEVREALAKWARAKNCSLDEVPVILAAEAHAIELGTELERVCYREKPGIMVAEGADWKRLLEQLAERSETEHGLADHLHVEMFTQLPGMVKRARRVRPLVLGQAVPSGMGRRYKEAVKAYVSGYAIACCVLCRAVAEAALKQALERRLPEQINLDYVTLSELIDRAGRVLSSDIVVACRQVKTLGDKAAHRETLLNLDEAHQALTATRQVLKSVFATS
jgi:hypothetical protein